MGFEPGRIMHIREGSKFLGNPSPELADNVGEAIAPPATPFQVVHGFKIFMDFDSMASDILSWLLRSRTAQLPSRVGNYVGNRLRRASTVQQGGVRASY